MTSLNQIDDSSFEFNLWIEYDIGTSSAEIVNDALESHTGTHYAKVYSNEGQPAIMNYGDGSGGFKRWRVKATDVVSVTWWTYVESGTQAAKLRLIFEDANNSVIDSIETSSGGSGAEWVQFSDTIVAPAGAYYVRVQLYLGEDFDVGDTTLGRARYDDITLKFPNSRWPDSLPNPDYGWMEGEVDGMIIRSQNDAGVPKQRLRYTAVAVPITATMTLSQAQLPVFKAFIENELKHVLSFDWIDMLDDSTWRTYRFTKKPTYTRANYGQIVVGMNLELMPS